MNKTKITLVLDVINMIIHSNLHKEEYLFWSEVILNKLFWLINCYFFFQMPPKRKVAAAKTKAGGKKAKTSDQVADDKPATTQDVIAKLKASENKSTSKKRKVDSFVPLQGTYEVL